MEGNVEDEKLDPSRCEDEAVAKEAIDGLCVGSVDDFEEFRS